MTSGTVTNLMFREKAAAEMAGFAKAAGSPERTQTRRLLTLLRANAATDFGREHGFADIATPADYRRRVPATTYEEFEPWIERSKTTPGALTRDPIVHAAQPG